MYASVKVQLGCRGCAFDGLKASCSNTENCSGVIFKELVEKPIYEEREWYLCRTRCDDTDRVLVYREGEFLAYKGSRLSWPATDLKSIEKMQLSSTV